jgi:PDZ domain-containing secreted protein
MKNLVENILDNGGVLKRATVGVVTMITDSITELVDGKLKIIETFMIASVTSGTAADGKFQKYDVFKSVTIDGTTYQLTRQHQLNDLLLKVREGDTIVLKVLRRGETETDVTIKFGAKNFTLFN